jgi:AraC-like DNA-binding protein
VNAARVRSASARKCAASSARPKSAPVSATGLPPMAYLARQRVEAAAEQLLHTESSVSQIGRAGWPDQNYFARRFKAHFGLSATEYRNRFAHRTRQFEDLRAGGRGS